MSDDASAADQAVQESWRRAAAAWEQHQESFREATMPVSSRMVEAIDPQPGQRVLELAAGPGETGFIAAPKLEPGGTLLSTDQSDEMVDVARRRAQALGVRNVEFAVLDAQRIELEPASFDAALCRFGYMLMGDPAAALSGTHKVLRPGGRLAMGVWDGPERNIWMAAPAMQLIARGAMPPPAPGAPTPFSMADPALLEQRLTDAGFEQIEIGPVELDQTYQSFDRYWEITRALAAPITDALAKLDDQAADAVRDSVRDALGQFAGPDGALTIPGSAIVASARA